MSEKLRQDHFKVAAKQKEKQEKLLEGRGAQFQTKNRFKKKEIKFVDYENSKFLNKFLKEQGRILPRRITGTSLKYQRKVGQEVKRARLIALLPFVTDNMK